MSNNTLQVINQYEEPNGKHPTRYDVSILVNGLPLVHVELKRRGIAIREAFNQIDRYGRESFWAGDGLFEYVQLFIISNGANTLYYSNTVRKDKTDGINKTKGHFEFASYWADQNNNVISDIVDFTKTFLQRKTLLNILTRYCVFDINKNLLVLRPYQITAIERVLSKINIDLHNPKLLGTRDAGGYIWHTTGSGKTLTSFKLAQLATENSDIYKVIFVVDRKDLDNQTISEYNRYQEGCVVENKNTKVLENQLNNPAKKIVVTTIQKLTTFIDRNSKNTIYSKNVVLIFDECHRSQFGTMHEKIISHFKKYMIFGFTGTPIFSANAMQQKGLLLTTEEIFGERLHQYNIVNAIKDNKVLPFRIEYHSTIKEKDNIDDKEVMAIDTKEALLADDRLSKIADYIVSNFDKKTHKKAYNSILACEDTKMAAKYYMLLRDKLKVALIYSYNPNEEDPRTDNEVDSTSDGINDENIDDASGLEKTSRDFLDTAINDYNARFGTSFDSGFKFSNYYKDVSKKMKDKEFDILIVVNMFLTGFDAPCLNTIWVDKNLQYHGLIQAFSRTNRIKDSVKIYGNVVCFRNLEVNIEKALSLFGDKDSGGRVFLMPYTHYYEEYKVYVKKLKSLSLSRLKRYITIEDQKKFIKLFGQILISENMLSAFDEFDKPGQKLLTDFERETYRSKYLDYRDSLKKVSLEKESILDDVVFEIELIKSTDTTYDEIFNLIKKYHEDNCSNIQILEAISDTISGSYILRSKKKLISEFINNLGTDAILDSLVEDWEKFFADSKEREFERIVKENDLLPDKTKQFLDNCFLNNEINFDGNILSNIMIIKQSRFGKYRDNKEIRYKAINREEKIKRELIDYFETYREGTDE